MALRDARHHAVRAAVTSFALALALAGSHTIYLRIMDRVQARLGERPYRLVAAVNILTRERSVSTVTKPIAA
ncbi:hypothetical protein [Arthrobacter sp. PAMC25284]|uniref:hypothetical protein n=1 Tax=Arthrobacter sp. PAMC25284 TaxID=2861279 RepID=UPI001C631E80|nr:hypothetical protein [Arthrobacter sp. PAMC25284]QYF88456.1 hypothetical protein KY499_09145 [Arthrobacter sp. PAMC25284]